MSESQEMVNNAFQFNEDLMRSLYIRLGSGDKEALREMDETAAEVSQEVIVTILIGGGGPTYAIKAKCSPAGTGLELNSAEFVASWTGNRTIRTPLNIGDALWSYTEYIVGKERRQ